MSTPRSYEDELATELERTIAVLSEVGFDKHRRCMECKTKSDKHLPDCETGAALYRANELLDRPDKEAEENSSA